MEIPTLFRYDGVEFGSERTSPNEHRIKTWILKPKKEQPCWNVWADNTYLGVMFNSSGKPDKVYCTIQLSESNYYPAYEHAKWPYALANYLATNFCSEGLDIANKRS